MMELLKQDGDLIGLLIKRIRHNWLLHYLFIQVTFLTLLQQFFNYDEGESHLSSLPRSREESRVSHSQITITRKPSAFSALIFLESRFAFSLNFLLHQSRLCFGSVAYLQF